MPGIFLSTVKKDLEQGGFPEKQIRKEQRESNGKQGQAPSTWKLKIFRKKLFPFYVACILLIALVTNAFVLSDQKLIYTPPIHPDFYGRKKELETLKQRLVNHYDVPIVAIWGESGIGKTELSIAFVQKYKKHFSFAFFIDGSTEETINQSYIELGEILGIYEKNISQLKRKVHRALEKRRSRPWLLIFDDIKKMPEHLPHYGGSILMTCNNRNVCSHKELFELQRNIYESSLLLQNLTGESESDVLFELVNELEANPLLIGYVGHYIAETPGFDVKKYYKIFSEFQKNNKLPFRKNELTKRYPKSLETTYKITMELLEKKEPFAVEFLKCAVFLHQKKVPIEYLSKWIEKRKTLDACEVELIQGSIIRELQNHAFIFFEKSINSFSIHRLLQSVLIESYPKEKVNESIETMLTTFSVSHFNPTNQESIRPFQNILPHCISLINNVNDPTPSSLKLAMKVSRYFLDFEHNNIKAEKYLSLAEDWAKNWNSPLRGRLLFLVGVLNNRKHCYSKAFDYFGEAHKIFMKHDENEDYQGIEQNPVKCNKEYQRSICIQYQGNMLMRLGLYEQANEKFEQALKGFQEIAQDGDHFDIARIIREQGIILGAKGSYAEAIEKLEKALAMQKRCYGNKFDSQPAVAASYRTLGDLLFEAGEYKRADLSYKKALAVNQLAYLTEAHPYNLVLYQKRIKVFNKLNLSKAAYEMEKKCKEIDKKLQIEQ